MRRRRPFLLATAGAVASLALVAAGCGGRGGVAGNGSSGAAVSGTTTVVYGTSGAGAAALAFARCMRAHGLPTWPDPESSGAFDKTKLRQTNISPDQARAVEEKYCHYDFENGGGGQRVTITPADRAAYLRAAACMRRHGISDFPDPTFGDGTVALDIPPSIDTTSPSFRSARATCAALIPAGLPYSRPSG